VRRGLALLVVIAAVGCTDASDAPGRPAADALVTDEAVVAAVPSAVSGDLTTSGDGPDGCAEVSSRSWTVPAAPPQVSRDGAAIVSSSAACRSAGAARDCARSILSLSSGQDLAIRSDVLTGSRRSVQADGSVSYVAVGLAGDRCAYLSYDVAPPAPSSSDAAFEALAEELASSLGR
jgi:hypothetical protein